MKLRSLIQRVGPNGTIETSYFACAHCNTMVEIKSKDDPLGFCHKCFYPLCIKCGATNRCEPFEKKLERIEARDRMLKNIC